MRDIPYVIDVRDDLKRALGAADADIDDDVAELRGRLDEYAERSHGDREGLLETMENDLLRLEESTGGDATTHIRAARNRLRVYRDTRGGAAGVAVVETKARRAGEEVDDRVGAADDAADPDDAEFWLTIANEDEPRTVVIELTLYDAEGDELASHASEPVEIDAGEQKTVTMLASVPDVTDYYGTQVVDESDAMIA